ncbi:MAG TPA: hypothetical protein VGV89_06635 [Thermoplasmata archaeon]|nr:hypothetical protein [Thermoplasmata archaeon]
MNAKRVPLVAGAIAAITLLLASALLVPLAGAEVTAQTTITANFNASTIPAGDVIWFASVLQWVGTSPTATTHVWFSNQTLTFAEPNGTTFTKNVPRGMVNFSTTATSAATVWDSTTFTWKTTVPASYKGDVFVSGFAFYVPTGGLPGSSKVTWSGDLSGDVHLLPSKCLTFNWKWAAAVYTKFTHSNAAIGVKPVDDNKLSSYQNSDHAGTPENFKAYLTSGATGGGGSNYTGSYSGTQGENECKS